MSQNPTKIITDTWLHPSGIHNLRFCESGKYLLAQCEEEYNYFIGEKANTNFLTLRAEGRLNRFFFFFGRINITHPDICKALGTKRISPHFSLPDPSVFQVFWGYL